MPTVVIANAFPLSCRADDTDSLFSLVHDFPNRFFHLGRNFRDLPVFEELAYQRRQHRADVGLPFARVNADWTRQHQGHFDVNVKDLARVFRVADFDNLQRLPGKSFLIEQPGNIMGMQNAEPFFGRLPLHGGYRIVKRLAGFDRVIDGDSFSSNVHKGPPVQVRRPNANIQRAFLISDA